MNGDLSLSLSDLRQTLEQRGVFMSLASLSEFVKSGNVAEQLGIGGKGNRLEIPPVVADILADFLPQYRAAKGRLPQAAGMLRSFLKQRTDGALLPVLEVRTSGELTRYGDNAVRLLSEIAETLKQQAIPPVDKLLSMKQAHEETGLPYAILRGIRVKVGNRLYVRRLDCLRVIQEAK